MSKKINLPVALLILICLYARDLTVRTHAKGGDSAEAAQNAAIVATTEAVLKETSELRELSILRAVKSGAQSRTEIERMIVKNLDEENTPAESHAAEAILKAYGLVPTDFDYRAFLIKLLTE